MLDTLRYTSTSSLQSWTRSTTPPRPPSTNLRHQPSQSTGRQLRSPCTRVSLKLPPSTRHLLRTLTNLPANQLTPNHHIRHRSLSPSPTVHQPRNPLTNPQVQFLLTNPRNPLDPSLGHSLTVHQRPRSHNTNLPSRPINQLRHLLLSRHINQLHLLLQCRHINQLHLLLLSRLINQLRHLLQSKPTTDQLQHLLQSRPIIDHLLPSRHTKDRPLLSRATLPPSLILSTSLLRVSTTSRPSLYTRE